MTFGELNPMSPLRAELQGGGIAENAARLATIQSGPVFPADEPDELDRALQVFRDNVRVRSGNRYRVRSRAGSRR